MSEQRVYGKENSSFQTAGGEAGVIALVETFYQLMTENPGYREIRDMHPEDLTLSTDKLASFLCGWMGGPKLYREKFGPISIPGAHAHLKVTQLERNQWLACMTEALDKQPYPDDFKAYLVKQLTYPADLILRVAQKNED